MRPTLAMTAFLLSACTPENPAPPPPLPKPEVTLADLKALESKADALSARLNLVQKDVNGLVLTHFDDATFNPSSKGYSPVVTPVGTFFIELEKITPYADGQRLTFKVGNIQSIDYRDPTFTVSWGTRRPDISDADYQTAWPAWYGSVRTKEEKTFVRLRAGHWSRVNIVVSPATSEQVGYISLRMGVETVSMPTQ